MFSLQRMEWAPLDSSQRGMRRPWHDVDCVMIHGTASKPTRRGSSALTRWLQRDDRRPASYHLRITPFGKIIQHVAFKQRAWHAGRVWISTPDGGWRKDFGNFHTIGVALDNPLHRGSWGVPATLRYPQLDGAGEYGEWHPYSDVQLQALDWILDWLLPEYGYGVAAENLIGHDEAVQAFLARGGKRDIKVDPGPLFPWDRYASRRTVPYQLEAER